jgi:hypothetical protein
MARLEPPIVIGDVRWDAVEFWQARGGKMDCASAWFTPKKKDGTWSLNSKRIWASGGGIPHAVVLAGAHASLRDVAARRERLADEERMLQRTIADLTVGA